MQQGGREGGEAGLEKPIPEPDENGNVRFPVVQLLSNSHVLLENVTRNRNLVQKMG